MRDRRGEDDLTSAEGHTESKLKDKAIDDIHGGFLRLNARRIHQRAPQIDYLARNQSDFVARSTRRQRLLHWRWVYRLSLAAEGRIGAGTTMIGCRPDYPRETPLSGVMRRQ